MSEDPATRRSVTPDDIVRLAELLDRFENADDPGSEVARRAEAEFEVLARELFDQFVKPFFSAVTYTQFRGHVRWRCREYLTLQARKPPSPPQR